MAGAEPGGDIQRGGEVSAGRRPGEDALVAGGLAGRGERPGLGDGDDLVVVGGMQLRWAMADAAALDVVGAGRTAGEHGRFGGLDNGPVEPGQRGGQRAADTEEAACGADIAAERADRREPAWSVHPHLHHHASGTSLRPSGRSERAPLIAGPYGGERDYRWRPAGRSRDRGARPGAARLRAVAAGTALRGGGAGRRPRRAGRAADRGREVGDLRAGRDAPGGTDGRRLAADRAAGRPARAFAGGRPAGDRAQLAAVGGCARGGAARLVSPGYV